jgi:hypothetical protein
MSCRSQSKPLRSIFSHMAGVSRSVRCTRCSSGGFGGLPRGRFGSSMARTVAPIYEDSNNPCNVDLSDYNKYMEHDALTPDQMRHLCGHLWACLHFAPQDKPGIPAWDIPITPKKRGARKVAVKCGRCDGKGAIACFSAQYSGKCFACDGSGFRFISEAAWKKKQALRKAMKESCNG